MISISRIGDDWLVLFVAFLEDWMLFVYYGFVFAFEFWLHDAAQMEVEQLLVGREKLVSSGSVDQL